MKKNSIILLIVLLALIIMGGLWYKGKYEQYAPKTYVTETVMGSITTDTITGGRSTTTPTFSIDQVGEHKDGVSCYTVIFGSVYDITLWVNLHPGGRSPILSLCGKDGSDTFMNKHHGGAKFMAILARYKIGDLQ